MPWFGHRILGGEIPYRDFFLHLPPLHPLAEAAIEALAGKSILAGRAFGAIGHLTMAALAAAWLARTYRPSLAVLGAVAALAVASADDTEILDLYNPHAALAALASGLFAAMALDRGRFHRCLGWFAGLAAGVAFWVKQTVGLGAVFAVPTALLLFALRDREVRGELGRLFARFAGGWMAVAVLIGGWLAGNGAFDDFLRQVFVDAAGSKGSPWRLFLRPWVAPFELAALASPARWALILALAVAFVARLATPPASAGRRPWRSSLLGLGAASLLVVSGPSLLEGLAEAGGRAHATLHWIRNGRSLGVLFSLYAVTCLGLLAAASACRRRLTAAERELTLFVVVAGAIALSQSLSFAATGATAFPALALLTAHGGEVRRRGARWLALPVVAVAGVALVSAVSIHRHGAFDFAGWREPAPQEASERSSEPALAGLTLSRATARTVDGVLSTLRLASDPGEPILSFPVYPIFHWLADRPTATFASLHWIDVTPDHVVENDLARILARPPVAVVRQWIPDHVLDVNERYFRDGRESALRRMHFELDRLLDARYRKVYVAPRRRHGGYPRIEVWVLAPRAEARGLSAIP